MAAVLAPVPRGHGRARGRFRAAVPRRRLDRTLVVAWLRRSDDGHVELRRRLRRGLSGRLPRHRHGIRCVRRGGEERHSSAPTPTQSAERGSPSRSSSVTRSRPRIRALRGVWRDSSTTSVSLRWRRPSRRTRTLRLNASSACSRRRTTSRLALEHYVEMYNPDAGIFTSRNADGSWTHGADFDKKEWGGDVTEASAWTFAFHAPHDVDGTRRALRRSSTASRRDYTSS